MYLLADSKPSCLLSDFKPDPGLVLVRAGRMGVGLGGALLISRGAGAAQVLPVAPPPTPNPSHLSSLHLSDSQLLSIVESLGKGVCLSFLNCKMEIIVPPHGLACEDEKSEYM